MDAVEHAVARPFPEIAVNRRPRREILRQLPPLAARAQNVAHRVHHLAHIGLARPAAPLRWRDQRFDESPFRVRQIARIPPFARRMLLARCLGPHGRPAVIRLKALNHRRFSRFKNFPVRLLVRIEAPGEAKAAGAPARNDRTLASAGGLNGILSGTIPGLDKMPGSD